MIHTALYRRLALLIVLAFVLFATPAQAHQASRHQSVLTALGDGSSAPTLGLPLTLSAPLAISADCEGLGRGRFMCLTSTSGGVSPYSYAWVALQNVAPLPTTTGDRITGVCTVYRSASVQVTVTDSVGATATATASFYCYGGIN